MIILGLLILISIYCMGFVGWALDLNNEDITTLMSWGSVVAICSLLIYLGFN